MSVSPARSAALEILMRVESTGAYASELLHSSPFEKLSPAEHSLLMELVMGVLRWRSVLDDKIAEYCNQPLTKLDREVLASLRLGAYQFLFLDRIPPHAAINESVELIKQARKKSAAGMVNAVLRRIAEFHSKARQQDQRSNEIRAAHLPWLRERWHRTYGAEIADKICQYDQSIPPSAVRINSDSPQAAVFGNARPAHLLASARLVSGDVAQTAAAREHGLIIQDEASQLVALLVGTGTNILDCCAAPGGKTRIIAQQNPNSTIVAMDLHPHRAKLMRRLIAEPNVRIVAADGRQMQFSVRFDRILVDAPCSGTGTLARNPDIKWRLKAEDIARLQNYQVELLSAAMKLVAQGGRIVYSTCSLESEENEQVIERAVGSNSSFRVIDCNDELGKLQESGELVWKDLDSLVSGPYLRTIPGVHPCDGFFAAVLQRGEESRPDL